MTIKQIATAFAVLGTGAFALTACDKEKPATEVPGGGGGDAGEAKCAADDHPGEGHCGGDADAEGSCGADAAEGDEGDGEGSCSADAEEAAE